MRVTNLTVQSQKRSCWRHDAWLREEWKLVRREEIVSIDTEAWSKVVSWGEPS